MTDPSPQIDREGALHGPGWDGVHEGYFSDPATAAPLLAAVLAAVNTHSPDVIADLGGGTGFLLAQLREAGLHKGIRLVNADLSAPQLAQAASRGIECLHLPLHELTRQSLAVGDGRLMFIMRSVLHYVGREGLGPLLGSLAAQMQPGEYFVHQTACFVRSEDAERLNRLYHLMQTGKWYPTLDELKARALAAGWAVEGVCPAPPLPLTWAALASRYSLSASDMSTIGQDVLATFGPAEGVLWAFPDGFTAWLHYHVLTFRRV